jgi:hypothetical protein
VKKALQQQRAQQSFGGNRRPSVAGIKFGKCPRQLRQRPIDNLADRAQRVVRRNAILQPQITEKVLRAMILAPHRNPQQKGIVHMNGITFQSPREHTSHTFSASC